MRSALAPAEVPIARTRSELFDELVLDAVDELEDRMTGELGDVEFAVEDVPPPQPSIAASAEFDPDVVADRGVPMGQLHRGGLGDVNKPVIVLYRRPIEARTADRDDRADLVYAVVAELVAELLGKDVDDIDPS
jgi:predicted Zn-dependent protease with MMP-like domain